MRVTIDKIHDHEGLYNEILKDELSCSIRLNSLLDKLNKNLHDYKHDKLNHDEKIEFAEGLVRIELYKQELNSVEQDRKNFEDLLQSNLFPFTEEK